MYNKNQKNIENVCTKEKTRRNIIPDFTQPEIAYLLEKCNFTKDERELFLLRNKETTLECCAEIMNYSISTIKRINRKMKSKIIRII